MPTASCLSCSDNPGRLREPFTYADWHAEVHRLRSLISEIISEVEGWSRDPLDTDHLLADWKERSQEGKS